MILNTLYAFLATLFFGIIFNIKGRELFYSALSGGLSWMIYLIVLKIFSSSMLAYFAASVFIGLYSEIISRIIKAPATFFIICGIIPLVPGSGMYYTMLESIQKNAQASISTGINTLFIAGDIVLGILVSSSIFKLVTYKTSSK